MSKERLGEISERVIVDKAYYKYLDGTKGHWGKTYTLNEEDYNYLKERVQELEEHLRMANQYVKKEREINTRLEQQNKRYREAIEKAIHEVDEGYYTDWIINNLRKALEGEE